MNDLETIPESLEDRKSDIQIRRSEIVTDSIIFYLPDQYKVENYTDPKEFKTDFGSYRYSVVHDENKVVFKRYFEIRKGYFPKERYDDLLNFYMNVHSADQAKAVLIKL